MNLIFSGCLLKVYTSLSLYWIDEFQLGIAALVRPWLLLAEHPWVGSAFYLSSLLFLGCLLLQSYTLLIGWPYFARRQLTTKSITGFFRLWGHALSLKRLLLAGALWVTLLPLSRFVWLQDYFTAFRLSGLYAYFLAQPVGPKIGVSLIICLWLTCSIYVFKTLHRQTAFNTFHLLIVTASCLGAYLGTGALFAGILMVPAHLPANWLFMCQQASGWLWSVVWLTAWLAPKKTPAPKFTQKFNVGLIAFTISTLILLIWLPPLAHRLGPITWIAHKGVSSSRDVQNSIAALKKTARLKPDLVELDVHWTKDHRFVVFHDARLKKLTGLTGAPESKTLAQLQRLDVTENQHTAPLSSLSAYLEAANKQHQRLLVEIKTQPGQNRAELVKSLLTQHGSALLKEDDQLHTTDPKTIVALKQQQPKLKVGYILPFTFWGTPNVPADFYSVAAPASDLKFSQWAQKSQNKVYIWTINDPPQLIVKRFNYQSGVISDRFQNLKKTLKLSDNWPGKYGAIWAALLIESP